MTDINTNQNPALSIEIIPLTQGFNEAFDSESFLKFHNYAVSKSNGVLKSIEPSDIEQADFAVIATSNGKQKGQCLLFNASNGANRVQSYLPHFSNDHADNIVLTSLSGKTAFIPILEEIQTSALLENFNICAKTKASNRQTKEIFEAAGFSSKGPLTVTGDNYKSYLYHATNKYEISAIDGQTDIATPPHHGVQYDEPLFV